MGSNCSSCSKGSKRIVRLGSIVLFSFLLSLSSAAAQSFEVGIHLAASQWSEVTDCEPARDQTSDCSHPRDLGIGGRLTWKPASLIGIDAELTWYSGEFPTEGVPFSDSRFEGLFGVTVGPRLNRVRPFAKVAAGFLQTNGTQERIICIAIFPPPLRCSLAADQTLTAFEFGGGVELDLTDRWFVRVDVTDRMLEYPGPTLTPDFEVRDDAFFGHALRFTIGAGFRF